MSLTSRRRLAAAIAGKSPDVGTRAAAWRTGIAVRPVAAAETQDAGLPFPGWWVTIDTATLALPVIAGATAAIEPGCPVWIAQVGPVMVLAGGVTTARTAIPAGEDGGFNPGVSPMHPWIRLRRTNTQAIADSTPTLITWEATGDGTPWASSTRAGSNLLWSSGTGVAVPFPGLWTVTANVEFAAHATGSRWVTIDRDRGGVTFDAGHQYALSVGAGAPTIISAHAILNCKQGDLLRTRVRQSSGGNLNIGTAATAMTVAYLGPGSA